MLLIVLFLIILGVTGLIVAQNRSTTNDSGDTENETTVNTEENENGWETETVDENQRPIRSMRETPLNIERASVEITPTAIRNGQVDVSAIIEANQNGECTFVFAQQDRASIRKTVKSSGSGGPINCVTVVPLSQFPSRGEWNLKVQFSNDQQSAESLTSIVL